VANDDELLDVTDIDICFDAGLPEQQFTLWPEDRIERLDNGDIVITLVNKVHGRVERIEIFGRYVRWIASREGKRKLPKMAEEILAEWKKAAEVS
jgi:hypothetical protein